METRTFEPMSVGGVLDHTFRIYKNNFLRFIAIVAVIQIPISLLMIGSQSLLYSGIEMPDEAKIKEALENDNASPPVDPNQLYYTQTENVSANPAAGFAAMAVSGLLAFIGTFLCQGALAKNISESYLGHDLSVGDTYRFIWPKLLTLLGAGILVTLAVYAGILLLVVPGIIFGLWFALTTPAIIAEDLKATEGMKRSKRLAKGNLGKIFAVGFLAGLISGIINFIISYVGVFVSALIVQGNMTLTVIANSGFSMIGKILAMPITSAACILLYYDLRIRKEGFDLEMLAREMEPEDGQTNDTDSV